MIYRYKGGCVLPCRHSQGDRLFEYSFEGGVVDASGSFVELSMLHEAPCGVGGAYSAECESDDSVAIYIGFLLSEWGNCLTDGLKKLWFLRTAEGRRLMDEGARVVYVTLGNMPLPACQAELWRLAGYDVSDWEQVRKPTRFREVIVPDNSFVAEADEHRHYSSLFTDEIEAVKRRALAECTGGKDVCEKVYLTRRRLKGHKDSNEKEVERLFMRLGYAVKAPETLPVTEQIRLMANASCVAATEGSVTHSAMFMGKGARLVVLKKADYFNGYQQAAERLSGVEVTYIKANHSTRTSRSMPWAGPFYLCVTPELAEWAGVRPSTLPYCLRPSYWLYCLRSLNIVQRLRDCLYIAYVRLFRK